MWGVVAVSGGEQGSVADSHPRHVFAKQVTLVGALGFVSACVLVTESAHLRYGRCSWCRVSR